MGNVSLKEHKRYTRHKRNKMNNRNNKRNNKRNSRHRRRGGMRSPSKDDIDPRELMKNKMKANVTRRRIESKANSEIFFPSKTPTRTRSKKPVFSEVIEEEE
jgi:hypothetical protein